MPFVIRRQPQLVVLAFGALLGAASAGVPAGCIESRVFLQGDANEASTEDGAYLSPNSAGEGESSAPDPDAPDGSASHAHARDER